MDAILNNPFRILGLEPTLDETIISERVSEIMMVLSIGQKVSFPIDEFYNRILVDPYNTLYDSNLSKNKGEPIATRNIETLKFSFEKLLDPIKRKYYALFALKLDKALNSFNADYIIEQLEDELKLNLKYINRFSHSFSPDFLNHFSEIDDSSYIIEKHFNLLKISNLIENGTFLKPKMGYIISQESNFSLEFDCQWIEGADNNCFSVFWGKHSSKNNYYSFGITGNGYFFLSDNEEGKRKENDPDFIGWKKSDTIIQYGKNHLEVRKYNDCIEIYINGNLEHKTNYYKKFYGNDLGLLVFGKQTVEFSNFKLNIFRSDINYASGLIITNRNFNKITNLTTYCFIKTFTTQYLQLSETKNENEKFIKGYKPSSIRLNLDKALILFGAYFRLNVLALNEIFIDNINLLPEYNHLSQLFLFDLFNGVQKLNKNEIDIFRIRQKLEDYSNEFNENLFKFSKNNLIKFSDTKDIENFPFDIDFFKQLRINQSHFLPTVNNPFRVLALKYNATDKEITKRVSDLLIYSEMGKALRFGSDLFFGEIDRSPENIKEAIKNLDNPEKKIYYSTLWFIDDNEADKEFLITIKELSDYEKSRIFRYYFIGQALRIVYNIEKNTDILSCSNLINKTSERIFNDAESKLKNFVDYESKYEVKKFCLYEEVSTALSPDSKCEKIDNQIIVTSNSENGVSLYKNCYFDKGVDYEIEFDCEWLEGEDINKLYCIDFCKDSNNNFYRLGLSANGSLYFDAIVNDKVQNIFGWHLCKEINIKSKNKLKIFYSFEHNDFGILINETYPDIISEFGIKTLKGSLLGNFIGVSVFGKQKISFSNFKISYTSRILKQRLTSKIKSTNITSLINLIIANICLCGFIEKRPYSSVTISLFGELINSPAFLEFAANIVGGHLNLDKSIIERYFVDDIYNFVIPHNNANKKVEENKLIEAFNTFSDSSQYYIVHKFIGKPILDIENSISKTKDYLKITPLEGMILGFNLYQSTKEQLLTIRNILSYTNYQYRLLANNLSDTLLDCCIIYFNALQKNRDVLLSEGNQILELINHSNTIALGWDVRKRVDENMEFFEKWVSDAKSIDQEKFKKEQERKKKESEKLEKEQEILRQEHDRQNQEKKNNETISSKVQSDSAKVQEFEYVEKNYRLKFFVDNLKIKLLPIIKFFKNIFALVIKYFLLILFAVIIIYGISNHKNVEPSKWKGNSLENGSSPYNSYFGDGIYDYRSKCWITFKNGNSSDAIACLVNSFTGTTIRNSYIKAGTNYNMSNLPEGIYKVKVFYGKDWNPEKIINNGSIKGGFDTDLNFSLSDNPKDLIQINITETSQGISYTTGEITLYTVKNGNMNQRNIDSNEFFK